MAPSVEKKMAELEMGLLHLQQNIDIPEITLPVHQTVAIIIKRYNNLIVFFIYSHSNFCMNLFLYFDKVCWWKS